MTQQKWPSDFRVERVANTKFPDLATFYVKGAFIDAEGVEHPDQQCVWAETDNDLDTARLIAAAPDLLAALKLVVDTGYPTTDEYGQQHWAISEKQRDIARAAIEKAEEGS